MEFKSKKEVQIDEFLRVKKNKISPFGKKTLANRTKPLEPLKYKLQNLPE